MRIDHVILAATDLDAAAARLEAEHALVSAGGGRHEGVGTHNRVIPLGSGYLEVMAVADPGEAEGSPLGRVLAAAIARRAERLLAWCVAVPDVQAVADRLATPIMA